MMKTALRYLLAIAAVLCLPPAAHPAEPAAGSHGVAAYVNGEPVTEAEIGHEGGPAADEDTMRRLEDAVARKALVRVARMTGLDDSPEIKAELRNHEEFLLVRDLIERKSHELARDIEITDEEAAEFARRMCYTIRYVKSEFGEKRDAEAFMEKSLRGRPIEWESEYTVVACEGVGLSLLDRLFRMEEGNVAVIGRGTRFYVVKLIDKEHTTKTDDLPGWDEVKAYLLRKKADEAIEAWIGQVVERSEVRYLLAPQRTTDAAGGMGGPSPAGAIQE